MGPRIRSRKNAIIQLNLMVVGMTGLGKTSFIRTFCETLVTRKIEQKQIPALQGPVGKTIDSYSMTFDIEEEGEKIALTIVDTPGLTDDFNLDKQLYEVLHYLEYQFDITLAEESKVKRNPKALDNQIHACLYFIDPSKKGLTLSDIRVLKKLTTRVNVIPVVAKADQLTISQRNSIKKAIFHDIFEQHKIRIYGFPEDDSDPSSTSAAAKDESDSDDDLVGRPRTSGTDATRPRTSGTDATRPRTSGTDYTNADADSDDEDAASDMDDITVLRKIMPFSVISYEEDPEGLPVEIVDPATGERLKGRQYPWGIVDVLDPNHCDFATLRGVLLTTHRKIFKDITFEKYYEQYRTEKLLARKASRLMREDVKKKILDDLRDL
ncbi:Septin-domain-containing protein [Jimgerdemannia flammicorona]|uniref:Septin-domain-containing protein n=1 Tax=Jimgerdemannia flammicorona TaxID=994334 RepID=A0A433PBW1_9FUNG|nr:Septin-domain-containing protein [Jimgerdemannia flammicorona]